MSVVARVREVVEPLVRARRCHLYDLELTRRGTTQLLRVIIDRPGGVDTDACTTVSQAVSRALDERPVMAGRYTLEVSSPGLERTLKTPDHFALIVGRDLPARVKAAAGAVYEGPIVAAGEDTFRLATPEGEQEIPYADVVSARTVFYWGTDGEKGMSR